MQGATMGAFTKVALLILTGTNCYVLFHYAGTPSYNDMLETSSAMLIPAAVQDATASFLEFVASRSAAAATKTDTVAGALVAENASLECQNMNNNNATTEAKPVWVAGYPGSGNELMRNIVLHLTGFEGRDVYFGAHCQDNLTATCKTHFPVFRRHNPRHWRDHFHHTAVLLIRNPSRSLPSHFNYHWEFNNNITGHSQQAPEEAWLEWSRDNFGPQVRFWKKLVLWWFEHWSVTTVVAYERLVAQETGPDLVRQIGEQLRAARFPVANDPNCQWEWCVKRKASAKRQGHSYTPGFTGAQKDLMLQMVRQLAIEFRNHTVLSGILSEYEHDIESDLRVLDD